MSGGSLFLAVRRVLQLQALTMLAVSTLALMFGDMGQARSAMLGGLVGFLPNAYFAFKFGRADPRRTAKEVVRTFYLGESLKLIITALLFVLVFQLSGILFMPLFIGFASVIMVFWFALLLPN
jgi:ATP synthase protein I